MRAIHSGLAPMPNRRHHRKRSTRMQTQDTTPRDPIEASALNWASDAPRGGRAVMNRFLTEKATVPLFFAQTLIQSLRDVGYNHTTSALCEHVDNAIQAKAKEVRVFFRETGK